MGIIPGQRLRGGGRASVCSGFLAKENEIKALVRNHWTYKKCKFLSLYTLIACKPVDSQGHFRCNRMSAGQKPVTC